MSAANDIINRACRLLLQLDSGNSVTGQEATDALTALNAMMDSWRNERLMVYSMQEETVPMVANRQTYTVGPSGTDLVTTRPVEIERAYILYQNISYPVRIIDEEFWALLPAKLTTSTWPDHIWPQMGMPNITLHCYPEPNASSSLIILTRVALTSFALTDTISLPPGWEDAMAFNLAVALAPEYNTEPSPTVVRKAGETKAAIKRANSRPVMLSQELSLMMSQPKAHIISDQP